ncbi:MAG TPA: hypothetical protein VGK27_08590 [Candidatus Deferrimicrobiaceae bacterium]|jgi:hypothetical protein
MGNRESGKTVTVRVRPGKAGAIALIVLPLLFLAFGVVLFGSVIGESEDGRLPIIMFGIIWCVVNLMLAGYGVYSLLNPKGAASVEVDITESDDGTPD